MEMNSSSTFLPPVWVFTDYCLSGQFIDRSYPWAFLLIAFGHPLQAPPLNDTSDQLPGDGFGTKDILISILIPLILDAIMIGCTVLVWKYGPLEGNPTWPADLGIFFQCFILFIVSLIHFFAWGNIVMMNTPILLACAIVGFIIQVIEEQFLYYGGLSNWWSKDGAIDW